MCRFRFVKKKEKILKTLLLTERASRFFSMNWPVHLKLESDLQPDLEQEDAMLNARKLKSINWTVKHNLTRWCRGTFNRLSLWPAEIPQTSAKCCHEDSSLICSNFVASSISPSLTAIYGELRMQTSSIPLQQLQKIASLPTYSKKAYHSFRLVPILSNKLLFVVTMSMKSYSSWSRREWTT